jgi:hypothetical protein
LIDDIDLGAVHLDISDIEGIDVTGPGNNLVQLSAQMVGSVNCHTFSTGSGVSLLVNGEMQLQGGISIP